MRIFSREYDLPEGVVDGALQAAAVLADLKHEQSLRGFLARTQHDPRRARPLIPPDEERRRAGLLRRAREGDTAAELELYRRYRVRLLPPVPQQLEARETDGANRGAQATGSVVAADVPTSIPKEPSNPVVPGAGPSPLGRRCACGAPLGPKAAKGRCRRCYNRNLRRQQAGYTPLYTGPCIDCGRRPGRGRSKLCLVCYRRQFFGRISRERRWQEMAATRHSITQVRVELLGLTGTTAQHEALDAVQRLLQAIEEGRALLERNPWDARRRRQAAAATPA